MALERKFKILRACLTNYSQFSLFFLSLSQKNQRKNILTFFTLFISHQSFFIIIQIKKIHYKTKLFHFYIKHSQILYHINHFLLYNTKIFHNTITYQIDSTNHCEIRFSKFEFMICYKGPAI
jgi:hypothetical protein